MQRGDEQDGKSHGSFCSMVGIVRSIDLISEWWNDRLSVGTVVHIYTM